MRELLQQALDALKEWDALIKFQYTGSSEAMSAMQIVAWRTLDTIKTLEAEFKPDYGFDRTGSHMSGEYVNTAEQEPAAWQDILHNITSRLAVLEQTAELDKLLVNLIKEQRAEIDKLRNQLANSEQEIMHMNTGRQLSGAKNPWVGLTDEEIISSSKFFDYMTNEELIDAVRELEAKLRSKNNG